MRKKVNSQEINDKITDVLQEVDNVIPNVMRKTYSFKGRKSPDIISKVLSVLTNPTDVIFDPFIGSGTAIIGSKKANRRLIGTELDNFTYSINKVLFERIDAQELDKSIKNV